VGPVGRVQGLAGYETDHPYAALSGIEFQGAVQKAAEFMQGRSCAR